MDEGTPHTIRISAETKRNLLFLGVCAGIVLILYGITFFGDFVFDDRGIVDHAALLSNLSHLGSILTLPYWTVAAGLYRPVTLLSYALNFLLLGSGPEGFHLVNLALYALTGWLLYLLVRKLFKNKSLAYAIAILFLVLPIHTEAVANIVGRAEILALLFSLLVFLELLKDSKKARYWLAGLWLFCAIASKETAIAAVPIAALIAYVKERGKWNRALFAEYAPAAVWLTLGVGAYLALRLAVLGSVHFLGVETSIVENPLMFVTFWPRIFTALSVVAMYVWKSIWPFGLCSDYSYDQIPVLYSFFNPGTIIGAALFLFSVASIIFWFKKRPVLALGSAFFLFALLPVSNLLFSTGTIAGERLMFYPSVGLCLYAAYAFDTAYARCKAAGWHRLQKGIAGMFIAITVFYGMVAIMRARVWLTEQTLFTSAAACAPRSVLSLSNLGAAYYLAGDLANAKRELLASRAIYGGYSKGINNLGLVYWKESDSTTARALFLEAASSTFPYSGALENLALMSLREGNPDEAYRWFLQFYSGDAVAAKAALVANGTEMRYKRSTGP